MSSRGSLYLIAVTFLVSTSEGAVSAETPNQKALPQVNTPIRKLGQAPRIRAMGIAMPLTNKECTGLGGVIDAVPGVAQTAECSLVRQLTRAERQDGSALIINSTLASGGFGDVLHKGILAESDEAAGFNQ